MIPEDATGQFPQRLKTVILTPGRWIFVCPCGGGYIAMRLMRMEPKVGTYCFYCKQEIGKYYQVMNERLDFSENRNGKLNCVCFTMFRLHHPVKNCVGAIKQIYLKNRYKGDAKVMYVHRLTIDKITIPMSKLDSGLSPEELRKEIRGLYKNRPGINWETQLLDFMVLEYLKDTKEPTLF